MGPVATRRPLPRSGTAATTGLSAGRWHRAGRIGGALLVVLGTLIAVAGPASAGLGFGVTPTFPSPVTVGDTSVPASLQIQNTATNPNNTHLIQLTDITLVPACGVNGAINGNCPAGFQDPGVFNIKGTPGTGFLFAVGEAGTACAGTTFTIANIDPTQDRFRFTPTTPVILQPPGTPGGLDVCRIDFTFDVLKAPTKDSSPGPGLQTSQIGNVVGLDLTTGESASVPGVSTITVNLATTNLVTAPVPTSTQVGGAIHDTATLSGGVNPAGTITFNLYGPADPTCAAAPIFTNTVAVAGNGTYTSANFIVPAASPNPYNWVAVYSGDANNQGSQSACGAEPVIVTQASPTLVTTASPQVPIGGQVHDTATLAGGFNPTGSITFNLYGPADPTCAAAPVFTSTVPVAGNGNYNSANFTIPPAGGGTYRWRASYTGDVNNVAIPLTACNAAGESVLIQAQPTITTAVSAPTVAAGTPIHDTATLAGGIAPTGTITFNLFGPTDPTCAAAPIFTATVPVAGNGSYDSPNFTPTVVTGPGQFYRWRASYSGDVANTAAGPTACNDPAEQFTVIPASPTITTTVSAASVPVGTPIHDTATLSGGSAPTGTITFNLFGPADSICAGPAIFTATVPVAGNGNYDSPNFTPTLATAPGQFYRWRASYSGDPSNNPAGPSACNDPAEQFTVTKVTPALSTNASASVPAGGMIHDTATLAGGFNPGGTITFNLFGPGDVACASSIFTSTVPVAGNGSYNSANFTANAAGTYRWVATYSGDANNNGPISTSCADAAEQVVVTKAQPTIVTNTSAVAPAGGQIHDTATLSGGVNPTGTITFNLYGPNDTNCANAPAFTATVAVAGNGNYDSPNFTANAAGTYRWRASYSGDANNNPAPLVGQTACADPAEQVVVQPAQPTIATNASASVPVGGQIHDTATLAGGVNPTGTITFNLYGPGDNICATSIFTATVPVAGNGSYLSPNFTVATATGPGQFYRWRASYSGDANNTAAGPTACLDPAEAVTVTQIPTALTTVASPTVNPGGQAFDTAILTGGTNPTGTITFNLYGPNDATCANPPVFTATVPVAGAGSYQSPPATLATPGLYRWRASYSGDVNNAPAGPTACADPAEQVRVRNNPTLVTTASPTVPVGGMVHDTATLAGGLTPTGTITFNLFGPNNPTCAGAPIFTATAPVAGNGSYDSPNFTTTAAGTYRWVASYGGDANNTPAGPTACTDPAEAVVVTILPVSLTTVASPAVLIGGQVHDTATLAGGVNPTGTITFNLYGPNDPTCANPAAFTATVAVNHGNGAYDSPNFTPLTAGTYRWIASYSGDANNAPAITACADPAEAVVVSPLAPAISTTASPTVPVGGLIHDTATLTGGTNPTGTITFNLYGPTDPTCAAAAVFTATVPVAGNGSYPSPDFTANVPGTYRWRAAYSGDANNAPAGPTACADPAESVLVTSVPTLATTASVSVPEGGVIFDTATLSGFNPTGTITFTLFGPDNPTCAGAPIFTTSVPVAGNGSYQSPPFQTQLVGPAGPGTYRWIATYSGDANNAPAGPTSCADPAESVVVTGVAPTIRVEKTADPTVRPEPGGTFTFTVVVVNTSNEPVTITSLTDDVYGNLDGKGTCAIGAVLAPAGGSYTCDFPGTFTGVGGDAQTDTVTAVAVDNEGQTATDTAQATVILTTVQPTIAVVKTATPLTRPEPGGTFTFSVVVTNTSIKPLTITSLIDDVYGDVTILPGTCNTAIGTVLAPSGGTYSCNFNGPFTGVGGQSQTDTVTATAVDQQGNQVSASDEATVSLTTVAPSIAVEKTANPLSLPEPGGTFTFTVVVTNTSIEPLTLTTLVDDVYGDLNGQGDCAVGAVLAANGGTYTCHFPGTFTGIGGDAQTDTVAATAVNSRGTQVTAQDNATVSLFEVPPTIAVVKTADPLTRPEPGGAFTFTVVVTNTTTFEPLTITSLMDDVYGDLNGQGSCAIGAVLAPAGTVGDSYTCTFTGNFTGQGGDVQTDTVTAKGTDARGRVATAEDDATVSLTVVPPTIAVEKTASPLSLPEPGGIFTFSVTVTNTTFEPLTVTSLLDDVYGNLNGKGTCAVGAVLAPAGAPGATYTCTFPGTFTGTGGDAQTDTVTATAVNSRGTQVTAQDNATVTLTPVAPTIAVAKTPDPTSRPEPGGPFTFTVKVTNTTPAQLTLTTLLDDVYGDLNGKGDCTVPQTLAPAGSPGDSYTCHFTANFTGNGGDAQTDTVTATAVNNRGEQATAQAKATVTLTGVPPTIKVTKTPDPTSRPEPGGPFTFTVTVTNTTPVQLTLNSLVDDVYGDLNGKGDCTVPQTLAPAGSPGDSYTCRFTANFTGGGNASQTDTVTAKAVNNRGQEATAQAKATVTLTPVPVVTPPPPPPPRPSNPLVRTGADLAGPARLALALVLVGLLLLAAGWRRKVRPAAARPGAPRDR